MSRNTFLEKFQFKNRLKDKKLFVNFDLYILLERWILFNSVENIKRFLKSMGYRDSYKRDLILQIVLESLHVDVDFVLEEVKHKFNIEISKTTVYNQFSILEKLDILKPVDVHSKKKIYELNQKIENGHLVCNRCKKVEDIDTSSIKSLVDKVANKDGFLLTRYSLILYGQCKECSSEWVTSKVASKK